LNLVARSDQILSALVDDKGGEARPDGLRDCYWDHFGFCVVSVEMQTLEHTYQEPMNKLIIERSADGQLLEDPTGDLHPSGFHAHIRLHQMRHDLLYGL